MKNAFFKITALIAFALIPPLLFAGLFSGVEVRIDTSIIRSPEHFTHCDCEGMKAARAICGPDCALFCGLNETFWKTGQWLNEQCQEGGERPRRITIAEDETDGWDELEESFQKATQKIKEVMQNQPQTPPTAPGCENCSPVTKIHNTTMPIHFDEETQCDDQYIKTHYFSRKAQLPIESGQTCSNEHRQKIFKILQQYSSDLLESGSQGDETTARQSRQLWESCPDGCSFYNSFSISIDMKTCSGQIDLYVNCNHQRYSMRSPDYSVNIYIENGMQCLSEET